MSVKSVSEILFEAVPDDHQWHVVTLVVKREGFALIKKGEIVVELL